ncbi:tetratricopeptide repeat protein [Spirochaeta africana]|uniref:Tetratricopeptide repeat protein n=1 Tax=Spirochaeta africana (strain ATCC 700263 / DSM 8902 / Z-7692) TaxID=889378 RepID=H9UJ19_SPIAZ|nr:tetratricopeptide repeat protein [Spirochaeta africana]AFG37512.1 tetratricopeptide repeat protein [Spirochaeta africana DSM 8902]
MPIVVVLIIILGVAIGFITFFIVRSLVAPKRMATLAEYIKQKKTSAAIKLAKQLIAKESRNPEAHYLLGQAYEQDGKHELALMEYKIVNQISNFGGYCPEVPFRTRIATLFKNFNQHEEALKEYLLLVNAEPNNAQHYYNVGLLFEIRERTDKAANYYRKALELDPRHGGAHYHLGFLLYRAKRPVEAKKELELAIRFDPDNHASYYYLGKLQKEQQDYVAALVAFEKAQKSPEFKTKALVERGACYLQSNNIDRAVAELERAIKLAEDPNAPEILYGRYFLAAAYEKLRNFEAAIGQWEKIYAKKPGFRDVAEKLSQYQEFRTDDRIKDYLIAGQDELQEMCRRIVERMGLTVRDINPIQGGCEVIAVEGQSKWRNARKLPKIIRFFQATELIDESTLRAMHEEMKTQGINRGVVVSSANFSRMAMDFVENRPIDLVDKEKLQGLLKQVSV